MNSDDVAPLEELPLHATVYRLVRRNIEEKMGALELLAGNVVVTGGSALMPGLDQVAADRFRLPVRIGKPHGMSGLVDVVASPAHSTAVGLVRYGMRQEVVRAPGTALRRPVLVRSDGEGVGGFLKNLRNILKDFF